MRRSVALLGVAAVAAGFVVVSRSARWARVRSRVASEIGPGAMPGELGSRINSWLNTEMHAQVAAELDLRPDDELLDVACGEGAFLATHGTPARFVAGLDITPAKVALARRHLADRIAAGTAEVAQGEAAALPWEDGRFTAVTTMDAIGWFPDPAKAVAEMYRVLRPGGRAVLQFGFRPAGEEVGTHKAMGGLATLLGEDDVRRMTEEAGFGDVSISYGRTAGDWSLYDRILRAFGFEEMRLVRAVRPALVVEEPTGPARKREPELVGSA